MPYTDYVPNIVGQLSKYSHARVIEIGVGTGVTFFSLAMQLMKTQCSFEMIGVDVLIPEDVRVALAKLELKENQSCTLVNDNSLNLIPRLIDEGKRFDVVMIDGDHNYHTVSQELSYIDKLSSKDGPIVVLDDYTTRWGEKDMWYSKRPGYEKNEFTTSPVETQKHGVKAAVLDFLTSSQKTWAKSLVQGDFIVLKRL